jgi:hypothetical protein
MDTTISIFDGITPNLLICNDDEGCPLQTVLTFTLPSDNLLVVLPSLFDGQSGNFALAWDDIDGGCTVTREPTPAPTPAPTHPVPSPAPTVPAPSPAPPKKGNKKGTSKKGMMKGMGKKGK